MPELAQLEYDHTLFEEGNRTKGDDKLYVRFFTDVLPDEVASKETGIRKFRDVDMIQIMVPGDKRNITIREAREEDKHRFAKHYERFKANKEAEDQIDGYPLSQWGALSRATAEELRYLGFRTIEHVAGASDAVLGKHPGLRQLQQRAKQWIESQKSAAPAQKLADDLQDAQETIQGMKKQMEEMAAAMAQLKKAA